MDHLMQHIPLRRTRPEQGNHVLLRIVTGSVLVALACVELPSLSVSCRDSRIDSGLQQQLCDLAIERRARSGCNKLQNLGGALAFGGHAVDCGVGRG